MLRLGWKAGPEQYPPKELLDYAISADKAGFDLLDASDHFHPWSEAGQAAFTWTWFGAVAVQTQRIHIGPGLTCPILRYHPSIIAQATATVSCLAPGRTYLAVGTGEALNEYAATGQWPGYEERQVRLAEAIELIRALWSGQQVSYEGKYYRTRKAKLYTPPASQIPLYVSSLAPASAHFAGKYGDGLLTTGGKKPDFYREMLKNFEAGAREAGKEPSRMPRLIELNVAYTKDKEKAIQEHLKYWASTYIPALYDQKIYSPAMSQENGEVIGADTVMKTGCFSDNAADHIKFAQQYIDLGFDHLIFHAPGPDQRAFIEGYARDVLQPLRSQNARQESAATV
jgi:coenzyme F420-dependent glucose-6-phosphate dehydrogenase